MQCHADVLHYTTYPIHVKDNDQWVQSRYQNNTSEGRLNFDTPKVWNIREVQHNRKATFRLNILDFRSDAT